MIDQMHVSDLRQWKIVFLWMNCLSWGLVLAVSSEFTICSDLFPTVPFPSCLYEKQYVYVRWHQEKFRTSVNWDGQLLMPNGPQRRLWMQLRLDRKIQDSPTRTTPKLRNYPGLWEQFQLLPKVGNWGADWKWLNPRPQKRRGSIVKRRQTKVKVSAGLCCVRFLGQM